MLLPDDVVYQILQWLPVISLLRFKLVCRTWRALIQSNDFIKQHLHCHHHDCSLKYKSSSLIHLATASGPPFTFPLVSIDSFDEPNAYVQLDGLNLRENSSLIVSDVASYNGIVCLNIFTRNEKQTICLWNPATKQSRFLPQLPNLALDMRGLTMVGIGFDVGNIDYKVVNLRINSTLNEERVEVYSLNTDSWRSVATDFPVKGWLSSPIILHPRMPFNNGTCFFWCALNSDSVRILCFDFSSEKFRSIPFNNVNYHFYASEHYVAVLSDNIACVLTREDQQTEIWVFKDYGSVNESWVKLYTIDPYSSIDQTMSVKCLSMNGKYLFFNARGRIVRYDVVTKEIRSLPTVGNFEEVHVDLPFSGSSIYFFNSPFVEFKGSLLSVRKGNNERGKIEKEMIRGL